MANIARYREKADWEKRNPLLGDGEPGFEEDTGSLKIGDGVKHWNDLPYVAGVAPYTLPKPVDVPAALPVTPESVETNLPARLSVESLDTTFGIFVNVKKYGAKGDGITDDTAAIQGALDSLETSGGTVFVPSGHYKITGTLTMHSNVNLIGAGEQSSFIELNVSGTHLISGQDLSHVSIRDLHLIGPGQNSAAFDGIHFDLSGNAGNATFYVRLENIYVEKFGQDGVSIQTPIVSVFDRVIVFHVGRHGTNLYSFGEADGTSCVLTACYVAGAWGAGIRLKQMAYTTLNGCAVDAAGIAYEYDTCIAISENGCGSEEPYNFDAHNSGYVGYSRKLFNTRAVFNSPYMIGNIGTSFLVTNGSIVTINSLFEGSPGNSDDPTNNPAYSLKVDSGCKATLLNSITSTAMSLAAGTTTMLPDAIGSGSGASSDGNALSVQSTMRRIDVASSTLALGASGSLRLTYFTATSSGTFNSLRMITGGTAAAATPTLCKMAIYSVAPNGNLTLVAVTSNDTALFAAANTAYTRATTAPFTLTAGQRYAIGVLVITAAALPTFVGNALPGTYAATLLAASPRMTAAYSGQNDVPSLITSDVLSTMATAFYAEVS